MKGWRVTLVYTNLRDSVDKMRRYESFNGNNLWGVRDSETYCVYSYWTCIFIKRFCNGRCYFDYTKHSRTTSRHQYYIRQAYNDTDFINIRFNMGREVMRGRYVSGTDNYRPYIASIQYLYQ